MEYIRPGSRRAPKAGVNRELQKKLLAKYDINLATECLEWIRDILNSSLQMGEDSIDFDTYGDKENFAGVLHDGVILARLTNALDPGSIPKSKYNSAPKLVFKQMELIELFIRKCKEFGVPDHECFQTVDLYEDQNLYQVTVCLQSLARKTQALGMHGFGPKESPANRRVFTEAQLRAGNCVIGLQMGTNKGASQKGMNFGKTRSILD